MKQSKEIVKDFNIAKFQEDLIGWFTAEQRDLPWRQDKDPYKVWVSEIMLQQTRVDTVIPYFNNFISKFPTLEHLADADEEDVLKAWEGLGYYSRARNLQYAVREVRDEYGGIVPETKDEVSKLKGVGPYTTGAILSIAYGVPEPAVDGNVMRVLSRILFVWEDIAKPKTRKLFDELVYAIISHENPSFFNQGLMELGALICTPKSPACLLCPVQEHCRAFEEGTQKELPVKTSKKSVKAVELAAAVVTDESGKVLIHKRSSKGLLANLWEFPNVEIQKALSKEEELTAFLTEKYGVEAEIGQPFTTISHVFSHLTWHITVYEGKIRGKVEESETLKLLTWEEAEQYAFPVSHQKMKKAFKERQQD
ncbi:A/G-specific adenine glycosylase [Priestia filamentosa]|uniref:A/G-specific adenine glycosylase n=1 Tax=Priestia filamentosa TaxID=1402861 RepID=UPI001C1E32A0|nr:A/G-specific adenine glycosylase [Priestia filamentosa]WCM16303.1 A/G-specific adenine glycosylase [Priestia filamentosa]